MKRWPAIHLGRLMVCGFDCTLREVATAHGPKVWPRWQRFAVRLARVTNTNHPAWHLWVYTRKAATMHAVHWKPRGRALLAVGRYVFWRPRA